MEEFEFARVATLAPSEELLSYEEIGSGNQKCFLMTRLVQRTKNTFFSESSPLKERAQRRGRIYAVTMGESRSRRLRILPVAFFGNASMNSTRRGTLYAASF